MTLFKYLTSGRIGVLEKLELRFTQPGALNDPFELRPRLGSLISEAEFLAQFEKADMEIEPVLAEAYAKVPEEQRALLPFPLVAKLARTFLETTQGKALMTAVALDQLRMMKEFTPLVSGSIFEGLNRSVGILSLTEVPDDDLMWAHYADNHRGFLLGFDTDHCFFNRRRSQSDECYCLRKVVYADVPPAPSLLAIDGDVIFLTKGEAWAYEKEWRMLAPLRDATRSLEVGGDTVHLYAFPPECLTDIVLGARASDTLETAVGALLRANVRLRHIRLVRAVVDVQNHRVRVPGITA